jgi:hypothetical protein
VLSLVVVLAAAAAAVAQEPAGSWDDPSLEDALRYARVVVRGHVMPPAKGESELRLAIEKIVAGEGSPGLSVPLLNVRGPATMDTLLAPAQPGDEGIFILRAAGPAEKPRLEVPTPSFGRFGITAGTTAGAFRDSFVRIETSAESYEVFLKNAFAKTHGGTCDVAWLDSCRTTLRTIDSTQEASLGAAHIALEGLAYGAQDQGKPDDVELGLRFFASPAFQVRISAARLLEHAGGARAGAGLLRLALDDADPAVRSTAMTALARVKPTPEGTKKVLLARLTSMEAAEITLHVSAEDPRTNELPAPMLEAFKTLRAIGAGAEASPLAVELLAKDDGDVLAAACLHLEEVKDKEHVHQIIGKMRAKGYQFSNSNKMIGDLLENLTGVEMGEKATSKDAWTTWILQKENPEKK